MNNKRMDKYLLKKFNEVERTHWWWDGRRALLKLVFEDKKPKKILDIGCGTGETLSYLAGLLPSASLTGIDSSALAVKYSKSRGHTKILKGEATKLPFGNGQYDTILFLDVLEHIKNDDDALREAKRVLKKGGRIIITAPALSFIWSNHDRGQGHKRRYTRRRIRWLAKETGLKITRLSYFNFLFSPPIILIRLLSNTSIFKKYSKYSNDINFNVIYNKFLNNLLSVIFVKEIESLKVINYPIGISIVAVLRK